MATDMLAPLREPCACYAGRTCDVCLAWGVRHPPANTGQVRGGLQRKRTQMTAQLPVAEAALTALESQRPALITAAWATDRKRAYEAVSRIRKTLITIDARLAALKETIS